MKDLSRLQSNIVLLGAVLVALVIVGIVLVRMVRARIRGTHATESFTLDDLRKLRAAGELSDAEYERMRAMLIGSRPAARIDDNET
jgi:hypothetical protein